MGVLIVTVAFGPFEVEGSKTKRTEVTAKGSKTFFSLKRGERKMFKVSGFVLNKDLFSSLSIGNYVLCTTKSQVMVTTRKELYVTVLIC